MRMLVGVLVLFGFINSIYSGVNFDNGVSNESLNKTITNLPVPDVKYGVPGSVRYTRDCARFNFGPSDNELISEKVRLRSDEYRT
ncbi:MAG: hypothetical protein N2446_04130, partial [Elusimicrobiales bacterium]|nr:hypothetical protein [Elusimicrobiales bacterium]